jgi:hypothetical protein
MAAAGRMLSVIREELPTVVSELASTAKVSTEQVGRLGEMEVASTTTTATTMNPIAVRQMASVSVKEGGTFLPHLRYENELISESSILSSLRQGRNQSTSLLNHLPTPQLPSINTSMVTQTLEMDVGVSVREAISNATQTGAGEVLEQVQLGDLAKVVAGGGGAHV